MSMSKKIPGKVNVNAEAEVAGGERYILKLFVTGILANSARAVINIKTICEEYLEGRYELEIIDIYQQPSLALAEEIIAIPVLIKKFPLPEARMIGDLSEIEKVLTGLDVI